MLAEYDLNEVHEDGTDLFWFQLANNLRAIDDDRLVNLAKLFPALPPEVPHMEVELPSFWKPKYIRTFISHSAKHREYVSEW